MLWTQEILDMAAKLWDEGKPASEVAYLLNEMFDCRLTRNAVVGKLNRLMYQGKLPRRKDYKPLKRQISPPEAHAGKVESPDKAGHKVPNRNHGNIFTFKPIPRPTRDGLVTIDAVTGCLYAVSSTDHGVHLFCNQKKRTNSKYCQEHHDRCYVQAMPPVKKILRVVR
jgi:hypothetical protein